MENLLIIFIVVTSVAVVIQAGILVGIFVAVKKSTARMEALATQVQTRALPTLDAAQSMINDYRPMLDTILANVSETSTLIRNKAGELDESVSDVVQRARAKVVRADELMNRTLDRVEHATELVGNSVVSPIRHASGVMQGITTGLSVLFGKSRPPAAVRRDDDMFI